MAGPSTPQLLPFPEGWAQTSSASFEAASGPQSLCASHCRARGAVLPFCLWQSILLLKHNRDQSSANARLPPCGAGP